MPRRSKRRRRLTAAVVLLWLAALVGGPGGAFHLAFEETLCTRIVAHDPDDHRIDAGDAPGPLHHHDCLTCHGSRLLGPEPATPAMAPARGTLLTRLDQDLGQASTDAPYPPRGPPAA